MHLFYEIYAGKLSNITMPPDMFAPRDVHGSLWNYLPFGRTRNGAGVLKKMKNIYYSNKKISNILRYEKRRDKIEKKVIYESIRQSDYEISPGIRK